MSNYIQVKDGKAVNFSDLPVTVGEDGWKVAVESIPALIEGRQAYGVYTYDVNSDPVVISREIISISVEDRKLNLIEANKQKFLDFANIYKDAPDLYSAEDIAANKAISKANEASIAAALTHDDLDSLSLTELNFF
jgi:hypothetical protein